MAEIYNFGKHYATRCLMNVSHHANGLAKEIQTLKAHIRIIEELNEEISRLLWTCEKKQEKAICRINQSRRFASVCAHVWSLNDLDEMISKRDELLVPLSIQRRRYFAK